MHRFFSAGLAVILSMPAGFAGAQEPDATLALTYAYAPTAGAGALADGYRKHLEWHAAVNDPILWYGWFVVEGERLGHFIDGAYDVTGAEFDARPDPAGDAADATQNFVPFVEMQYRRVFRLRADLGTSKFLEERDPSPLMQVVYYDVRPGRQPEFEAAAAAVADAARRQDIRFTVYEMLTGSGGPLYALYVPLDGFRSFDETPVSLEQVARSALAAEALSSVMTDLAVAVESSNAEVWQYRADLSLIPGGD